MSADRESLKFQQDYAKALRGWVVGGLPDAPDAAMASMGPGPAALSAKRILALAVLHEHVVVAELLPDCPAGRRSAVIRRAAEFFAVFIAGELVLDGSAPAQRRLVAATAVLSRRCAELALSNLKLNQKSARCLALEKTVRSGKDQFASSVAESEVLKQQLRDLSRHMLFVQEEERKRISRELHDVVSQTLTGINIRLAALKKEAALHSKELDRQIALTQQMVVKSTEIVHRFVRELRPPSLDDLGLVSALHSHVKQFTARTGIRVNLTASASAKKLHTMLRTVLFRVAQEALNNVARHAKASSVEISILEVKSEIVMRIADDGISFSVDSLTNSGKRTCLGLIGMRERVEMVGGVFTIESSPGNGTAIEARVPFCKTASRAPSPKSKTGKTKKPRP